MVRIICLDFDGRLTDGTTWYAGDTAGWVQRYSVRDGEAIHRLRKRGVIVVPLSRNATSSARKRAELLQLPLEWLGVTDKLVALRSIFEHFGVAPAEVCLVGDGREDALLFEAVGLGIAVADAHPTALAVARRVLGARGGQHAIEELESYLEQLELLTADPP
jgi:3-deoxy-D-manno-octulosonate 8-phosphate phosphatase (KDO 8-P phosphatase)